MHITNIIYVCLLFVCVTMGYKKSDMLPVASRSYDANKLYIGSAVDKGPRVGNQPVYREAGRLGELLVELVDTELMADRMQRVYDGFSYYSGASADVGSIILISKKITKKIDSYRAALNRTAASVVSQYRLQQTRGHGPYYPVQTPDCCRMDPGLLAFSPVHQTRVSFETSCYRAAPSPKNNFVFNPNLTASFSYNLAVKRPAGLKWQWYSSASGVHNVYPAVRFAADAATATPERFTCEPGLFENRNRMVYVHTAKPQPKYVVVVLDRGRTKPGQIAVGLEAARSVVFALSESDRVAVVALSDRVETPSGRRPNGSECLSEVLAPATSETKGLLAAFLSRVEPAPNANSSHAAAFDRAFEILAETYRRFGGASESSAESEPESGGKLDPEIGKGFDPDPDYGPELRTPELLIVYLSPGFATGESEVEDVVARIGAHNARAWPKVSVLTYLLAQGETSLERLMFLRDVAALVRPTTGPGDRQPPPGPGKFSVINILSNIANTVGSHFYQAFSDSPPGAAVYAHSTPRMDSVSAGYVVTISRAVRLDGDLLGVVGVDVDAADLFEDVAYFGSSYNSYAFLIDPRGLTLSHPALPPPSRVHEQPALSDISHYESLLRRNTTARLRLLRKLGGNLVGSEMDGYKHYTFTTLQSSPYKVAIVRVQGSASRLQVTRQSPLQYHRIDITPPTGSPNCLYLKQLANYGAVGTLLAPGAFNSHRYRVPGPETPDQVREFTSFLRGSSSTNINVKNDEEFPIKPHVKEDLNAASFVDAMWSERHRSSASQRSVLVRRYLATSSGALQVYPATLLRRGFDARETRWYRAAVANTGRVALSSPWLDPGGAGYVVTVSVAIAKPTESEAKPTEAKPTPAGDYGKSLANLEIILNSKKHAESVNSTLRKDKPEDSYILAVMAMDVTMQYVYKVMVDVLGECKLKGTRCFIIDSEGFIVVHDDLFEPVDSGLLQRQHITHKEPLIANDLLNHDALVRKLVCNDLAGRAVRRFYRFEDSLRGSVTNAVHGESCSKYWLAAIPGTNAFLGMVNQTCDHQTAFCPCSTTDRSCLNCARLEQTDCECPCECELRVGVCSGISEESDPTCRYPDLPPSYLAVGTEFDPEGLPLCVDPRCREAISYDECFGTVDCEWCVAYRNRSRVSPAYCAPQRECFGGVVGAPTPYGDGATEKLVATSGYSVVAIGPVAGGIMAGVLVVALAVYIYRHHRNRRRRAALYSLAEDTSVRMSHMERDDTEETEFAEANLFPGVPLAVGARRHPAYRRAVGGQESDHGYSTMSPHEDSECPPTYSDCMSLDKSLIEVVPRSPDAPKRAFAGLGGLGPTTVIDGCPEAMTVLPSNRVTASVEVHMIPA